MSIYIRPYIAEDVQYLAKWNLGPQEWKKWDAPYFAKLDDEEMAKKIDLLSEAIENDELQTFDMNKVIALTKNNQMIGDVSWYWLDETPWPAIGICIYDPKNWGKGYATEAIALWTKMVFAQLPDIWRIDMATWSGNVGMMKVAEKVGYTLEGRFRKARIVDNKYYDSLRYGILREDLGL